MTVTNTGPSNASGVVLAETLTLPAGVTLSSITPSGATGFADPDWTVGDLAVGDSETLTIVLTVADGTASGPNVIAPK